MVLSKHSLQFLLIILYVISALTPYIYSYYLIIPCVIGLLILLSTFEEIVKPRYKLMHTLCGAIFLVFAYRLFGYSTASLGNYAYRFLIIPSVWSGLYTWNVLNVKQRRFIIAIVFLTLFVNMLDAMRLMTLYPDYDVMWKNTENYEGLYDGINIGSAEFNYGCMFLILFILFHLRTRDSFSYKKIYLWICLLTSFVYIFAYAQTMTIILTLLLTAAFFWFSRLSILAKSTTLIVLITTIILLVYFWDSVLLVLVDFVTEYAGQKVALRLITMSNVMSGNINSDDMDILARIPMLWRDIQTWLSSPITFIFGYGYHLSGEVGDSIEYLVEINKIGNHSGIFDFVARYGLAGLFFTAKLMKQFRLYLDNNINKQLYNYGSIIFWVFILNSVFNYIFHYNILLVIFLLVPFIQSWQFKNQDTHFVHL